jgi:hypothetical protein
LKKTSSDKVLIADGDFVKVKRMNHLLEVRHSSKANYKSNIKKLDKDRYLDIGTGEIKEFTHIENRSQSYNSLRQTFKKLSDLINNNFVGKGNELHVTLTYEENMTDTKRLYKDFKRFMTRLKRNFKDKSCIEYISVVEPQERGAWHCHVLLRFDDLETIYIPNQFDERTKKPINAPLYEMWEQGWVTIKSLKNVDNIGAYLSAYLTDIELTEDSVKGVYEAGEELKVKEVQGKKFIKGGRLHMYPPGMNLYRKSKGIVPPMVEEMSFGRVKKIVGAATPTFQKSTTVSDGEFEVIHQYVQYNMKRHQSDKN